MSLREKVWLHHKSHQLQEALVHRNARLNHWGRRELVGRVEAGTPIAHVAEQTTVSRATASKWWHRDEADPDGH